MSAIHQAISGILFALLPATSMAAAFVAPTDAPAPFRRDLLPVDSSTMVHLSRELCLLSQTLDLETPENRRAAAQSLALAVALDPANTAARETISDFESGTKRPAPDSGDTAKAKARVWQIHGWLTTPQAGSHGNILALHLGDVGRYIDPEHPTAIALKDYAESGRWEGWVAALSDFSPEQKDEEEDAMPERKTGDTETRIQLASTRIGTVVPLAAEAGRSWAYEPTSLILSAEKWSPQDAGDRETFSIRFPTAIEDDNESPAGLVNPILGGLRSLHPKLPKNTQLSFRPGIDRAYAPTIGRDGLTGPALVLANAAITGEESNAIILAAISSSGGLVLPANFWSQLRALENAPGGKLIVPAAAEGYLTSYLALEMPDFFMRYEVFIASNVAQMVALAAKDPSEEVTSVMAKFAEVREKRGSMALTTYLANRFVRQRLVELHAEAPYHLSAKLLATQGGGERPTTLSRKVLAAELLRATNPIPSIARLDYTEYRPELADRLDETYNEARAAVDKIERYVDIRDRELHTKAKDLTITVRTLSRALRGRGEFYERVPAILSARGAMTRSSASVRGELAELSGESLGNEEEERRRRGRDR